MVCINTKRELEENTVVKIESPYETLKKWSNVSSQTKITFITGIISGMLFHMYMLLNKIPNHDDLGSLFSSPSMNTYATYGRWFLPFLQKIGGAASIPWVSGVITILCISLSACIINKMFSIKNHIHCGLIVTFLIGFPTIASTFGYMYTVDSYLIAFLLSIIGTYMIAFFKNKYIGTAIGILLIILSCAVYQLYFFTSISVLFILIFLDVLDNKNHIDIIKRSIHYVSTLLVSYVGYIISTKLVLGILNLDMMVYKGRESFGLGSLLEDPSIILMPYKMFVYYFVCYDYRTEFSSWMPYIHIGCLLMGLIIISVLVKANKVYQNKINILLLVILVAVFPFVIQMIYITTADLGEINYHMAYNLVFVMIFFVVLLERLTEVDFKGLYITTAKNVVTWLALISCMFTIHNQYIFTNTAYLSAGIAYEQAYSYYTNLMGRIEEIPGYNKECSIALVGNSLGESGFKKNNLPYDSVTYKGNVPALSGLPNSGVLLTTYARRNFMKYYLGVTAEILTNDEGLDYLNNERVQDMPVYPAEGSIQIIDEIIVVKLVEQ